MRNRSRFHPISDRSTDGVPIPQFIDSIPGWTRIDFRCTWIRPVVQQAVDDLVDRTSRRRKKCRSVEGPVEGFERDITNRCKSRIRTLMQANPPPPPAPGANAKGSRPCWTVISSSHRSIHFHVTNRTKKEKKLKSSTHMPTASAGMARTWQIGQRITGITFELSFYRDRVGGGLGDRPADFALVGGRCAPPQSDAPQNSDFSGAWAIRAACTFCNSAGRVGRWPGANFTDRARSRKATPTRLPGANRKGGKFRTKSGRRAGTNKSCWLPWRSLRQSMRNFRIGNFSLPTAISLFWSALSRPLAKDSQEQRETADRSALRKSFYGESLCPSGER